MGKTKRLRNSKKHLELFEIYLKYFQVKSINNSLTLQFIKECVYNTILPFIADGKTTKEAWDTLESNFGVKGIIHVEDEDGSIAIDL